MAAATTRCLVDSKFGPGHTLYIKTKADVPAEAVWFALKDFSPQRPTWWPLIEPSLYQVHDVGELSAEVTEGSKMPGRKIWARERYDWDDDAMEMRSTIIDSNLMKPGGTGRIKVTRDGDGCTVEEWYDRERTGLMGKLVGLMAPRVFPRVFNEGRAKTYAKLAERKPQLQ